MHPISLAAQLLALFAPLPVDPTVSARLSLPSAVEAGAERQVSFSNPGRISLGSTRELGVNLRKSFGSAAPEGASPTSSCAVEVDPSHPLFPSNAQGRNGPFRALETHEALAFVLAHELGHCFQEINPSASMELDAARERFAEAYASCAMRLSGLSPEKLGAISRSRAKSGMDGMSEAIESALRAPGCRSAPELGARAQHALALNFAYQDSGAPVAQALLQARSRLTGERLVRLISP